MKFQFLAVCISLLFANIGYSQIPSGSAKIAFTSLVSLRHAAAPLLPFRNSPQPQYAIAYLGQIGSTHYYATSCCQNGKGEPHTGTLGTPFYYPPAVCDEGMRSSQGGTLNKLALEEKETADYAYNKIKIGDETFGVWTLKTCYSTGIDSNRLGFELVSFNQGSTPSEGVKNFKDGGDYTKDVFRLKNENQLSSFSAFKIRLRTPDGSATEYRELPILVGNRAGDQFTAEVYQNRVKQKSIPAAPNQPVSIDTADKFWQSTGTYVKTLKIDGTETECIVLVRPH